MNQIISVPSFEGLPLRCGTTTRRFPLKVARTRDLAEKKDFFISGQELLNMPSKGWALAEQIHGGTVILLKGERSLLPSAITLVEGADGLITQTPAQTLSILTADCLPIFFYLEDPPSVGLVHAGWRGTAKGIASRAVSGFGRLFTNSPQKLRVAFGPSIRSCCYEVGKELQEFFPGSLEERQGRFYLDLVEENRRQLLEAGLLPERIGPAAPCCGCHRDTFYSYRKEGDRAYRMLSWIALASP